MAGSMPVATEAVAGIVVTRGVLNKIGGAIVFGINQILEANNLIDQPKAMLEPSAFLQNEDGENGQKTERENKSKRNKEKKRITAYFQTDDTLPLFTILPYGSINVLVDRIQTVK